MKYKKLINTTQEELEKKFKWLTRAEFWRAVIEVKDDKLIWHDGIWKDGDWYTATWKNGEWRDGFWYGGTWENGIWKGGIWINGIWKNGTWEDGEWNDGIWEDGIWIRGKMWSSADQEHYTVLQEDLPTKQNATAAKYKKLINTTESELEEKFPWLKEAKFQDAEIEISGDQLIWKYGRWEDGFFKGDIWENGIWEYGYWEGTVWMKGLMWCNIKQKYCDVMQEDGEFLLR